MIEFLSLKVDNNHIVGFLHKNEGVNNNVDVFIQHGYFSSNSIGPNRLYFDIAENLAKIGFNVYRFDMPGCGNSSGELSKADYNNYLEIHKKIVDKFHKKNRLLVFIGHSMGSSLSYILSDFYKTLFSVLISPTFGVIDKIENLFSKTQQKQLTNFGFVERKGLIISEKFLLDAQQSIDKGYPQPLLIFGLKDEFFHFETVNALNIKYQGKLKIIENADHNFIGIAYREQLMKAILNYLSEK